MLISNSQYISGSVPKVIETQLGILLNGQYYMKDNLIPVPFVNNFIYGAYNQIMTNKRLQLVGASAVTQQPENNDTGIIVDEYAQDTFYIFSSAWATGGGGTTYDRLIKIKETEEEKFQEISSFTSVSNNFFIAYLGQSETSLYFAMQATTTLTIIEVNKTTMTSTNVFSLKLTSTYPNCIKIHEDSTYIYFGFYNLNSYYISRIIKANSGTAAYENISIIRRDVDTTNYNATVTSHNIIDFGNNVYGLYFVNVIGDTAPLRLIKVDTNLSLSQMVTVDEVSISWNAQKTGFYFDPSASTADAMLGNRISTFITKRMISSEEKTFVSILVRYHLATAPANFIPQQGLYTFEASSPDTLTLTDFSPVDQTRNLIGCLFSNDFSFLVMGVPGEFFIMKFNDTLKKYERIQTELSSCFAVGLDKQERVWYQKMNYEVEVVSLTDAATVNIEFEKTYYEYDGVDINTYILFYANDFLNNPSVGSFELSISGSAVFTESNNKKLTFDLPEVQPLQIPIKITGSNQITIYPKFIEEI